MSRRPATLRSLPVLTVGLAACAALAVPTAAAAAVPTQTGTAATGSQERRPAFDLEAHRGGRGLWPENTLPAFAHALRLGVTTLEMDVVISQDGKPIVTHDPAVNPDTCKDTRPAKHGDPEFPYVGDLVHELNSKQIRTLDCGSKTLDDYPQQQPVPGAHMPHLQQVFRLVDRYGADGIMMNIESKVEAAKPKQSASPKKFVHVMDAAFRKAHVVPQVTFQSFDWRTLMMMRRVDPRLPLVALTDAPYLEVGKPGRSPWLGGLDIDDFGGDPVKAIQTFGADIYSPSYGTGTYGKKSFDPFLKAKSISEAHRVGIKVVPYTLDDRDTMRRYIHLGVDGEISDYPNVLRHVVKNQGLRLPRKYDAPSS
ncbi:MAG: glycerophosphodiester phosphodiesterase family protein [Mycobacteriales bacterium]